jgi:hypothetical protein
MLERPAAATTLEASLAPDAAKSSVFHGFAFRFSEMASNSFDAG